MPREIVILRTTREEYLADAQESLDALRGRAQRRLRNVAALDDTLAHLDGMENEVVLGMRAQRDRLLAERDYIVEQLRIEEEYAQITATVIEDGANDEALEQQRRAMDALRAHRLYERQIRDVLGRGTASLVEDGVDDTYRPGEEI
jgi:hypothetical protein